MIGSGEAQKGLPPVLSFVTLGMGVLGTIASLNALWFGPRLLAWVVLCGIAVSAVNLWSAKRWPVAANWRFCWLLFGVVWSGALIQGGLFDPPFAWVFVLPLVAMLMVGRNGAALFTLLVLVGILIAWAATLAGHLPRGGVPAGAEQNALISRITLVLSIGICLIVMDRRNRVAEQRLMESERRAAVGELSTSVAHQINNPLTYLLTNLELMERFEDQLDPAQRERFVEMCEDALNGAERVRHIVASLGESSGSHAAVTREVAPGRRRAVLVIDDEPLILNAIVRALPGHDIRTSSIATEALALALAEPWDVVLCDLTMPTLSGLDLYRRVEAVDPALAERFVFITGAALGAEERAFADRPDLAVVAKPLDLQVLEGALVRAAARGRC